MTDLEFSPVQQQKQNSMTMIEQSRAVQEVQASLIIAKRFPRDLNTAYSRIIESCKRLSLANTAFYSYPRGGEVVSGPSIRLAEVIAQSYGNLDFGVREIERRIGASVAEAYCWDMETNTRQTKIFEVGHEIYTKKNGIKKLTDPRDIYEIVANNGARRLRACILGIIPADITEAAVNQCRQTISKGTGEPIADRIRKLVVAFKDIGVNQEMLEGRLNHKIDLTTVEEIVELTGIYTAIRDKQAKRQDFFEFIDDESQEDGKAAALRQKLNQSSEEKKTEPEIKPLTISDEIKENKKTLIKNETPVSASQLKQLLEKGELIGVKPSDLKSVNEQLWQISDSKQMKVYQFEILFDLICKAKTRDEFGFLISDYEGNVK
jgi:hypothetical protein